MSRGITRLNAKLRRPAEVSVWTWATVTGTSPLRIRLENEADPLDITPDKLVSGLVIGDRVRVELAGNTNPSRRHRRVIIHGKAQ